MSITRYAKLTPPLCRFDVTSDAECHGRNGRIALPCVRHTPSLVIRLSAKVLKTPGYRTARIGMRWNVESPRPLQ